MEKLKIISCDQLFEDSRFVASGHLFYSPEWISVLKQEYAFDLQVVVSDDLKEYLLFSKHDGFPGKKIVSLPFSDVTIPIVDAAHLEKFLWLITVNFPHHPCTVKVAGDLIATVEKMGWKSIREAMYHTVDTSDQEAMWKNLSPSFSQQTAN